MVIENKRFMGRKKLLKLIKCDKILNVLMLSNTFDFIPIKFVICLLTFKLWLRFEYGLTK